MTTTRSSGERDQAGEISAYDLDLLPTDHLLLVDGAAVGEGTLTPQPGTRPMRVNAVGTRCLEALEIGTTLRDIGEELAEDFDVEEERARDDALQFVAALDRLALLRVRKDWRGRLRWPWPWLRLLRYLRLDWPVQLARRHPSSARGLLGACLRVSRPGLLAALLLSIGLVVVLDLAPPWVPGAGASTAYALLPVGFAAVQVVLLFAHEYGHLAALRRLGVRDLYLSTRGLSIGIAHSGLSPGAGRIVAAAGPALALGVTVGLTGSAWLTGRGDIGVLVAVCGLLHLYSFMPWTADGRMLWRRASNRGGHAGIR